VKDSLKIRPISIVTGGNSGIGKEVVRELARAGYRVAIVDKNDSQRTKQEIEDEISGSLIDTYISDLSEPDDIRSLAKKLLQEYDHIDLLVNNAGKHLVHFETNSLGVEMNFALNCLSHFLLTRLLINGLLRSEHGRIINIASEAHRFPGHFRFDDTNTEKENIIYAYGKAKLGTILLTKAFARKLENTNLSINAVCPGLVASDNYKSFVPSWLMTTTKSLASINIMSTPAKGAELPVSLALSGKYKGVSGEYFSSNSLMKMLPANKCSEDNLVQDKMWQLAEKMTGLTSFTLAE